MNPDEGIAGWRDSRGSMMALLAGGLRYSLFTFSFSNLRYQLGRVVRFSFHPQKSFGCVAAANLRRSGGLGLRPQHLEFRDQGVLKSVINLDSRVLPRTHKSWWNCKRAEKSAA